MNKILMVSVLTKKEKDSVINIIILPIHCSKNDEPSIKNALESKKNDPRFLIAIMTQYIPRTMIASHKTTLDKVKQMVEHCESLLVDFVDIADVVAKIAAQQKNSVLHDFCPN